MFTVFPFLPVSVSFFLLIKYLSFPPFLYLIAYRIQGGLYFILDWTFFYLTRWWFVLVTKKKLFITVSNQSPYQKLNIEHQYQLLLILILKNALCFKENKLLFSWVLILKDKFYGSAFQNLKIPRQTTLLLQEMKWGCLLISKVCVLLFFQAYNKFWKTYTPLTRFP